MAFSSLLFLTLFLPSYVILYWAAPRIARNAVVLSLSIAFYAWGAPWFLPVVLALGIVDFFLARAIDTKRGTRVASVLVTVAVVMHLSVLAYFKYSNFFVAETSELLAKVAPGHPLAWTKVALPIGVSFLTFEEISYVVDVYRGDAKPSRSVPQYLLFLMLFPHSIAGPIFRWKDLENQLANRGEKIDDVVHGLSRFAWGLSKKILVADAAAIAADAAFALAPERTTFGIAWVGAIAYSVQIFYDFSGYSDMAIGLGRVAGFRFKENFRDPYSSASITEFWTRWHISLSSWLRDYLYVPLGGNRRGEARARVNVLVVFVLSGLWHGAAWTFVMWGFYHGVLTLAERTEIGKRWRAVAPRVISVPITFALVVVGWVFFRAVDAHQAFGFIAAMAGFGKKLTDAPFLPSEFMPARSLVFLVIGLGIVAARAAFRTNGESVRREWLYVAASPVLFALSLMQVVNTKFVPLIYFKF